MNLSITSFCLAADDSRLSLILYKLTQTIAISFFLCHPPFNCDILTLNKSNLTEISYFNTILNFKLKHVDKQGGRDRKLNLLMKSESNIGLRIELSISKGEDFDV